MMRVLSQAYLSVGERGQAMIELAVFGSFFLLLLGALLSYGLKYNYQQRAQQTAFRRALKIASDQERGSGSAMIMEDRSIPDPMSLFGVGSAQTVTASASVQRDYEMNNPVDDAEALQGSIMDIQTKRDEATGAQEWMRRTYRISGFRVENDVPEDNIEKYQVVYGNISAKKGSDWVNTSDPDAEKYCMEGHSVEYTDPETGYTEIICNKEAYAAIRIIDSCSGEIVDFDTCYTQSRMLVDTEFCTRKCGMAKIPGSETDCNAVCNRLTNPPHQPSSAVGYDYKKYYDSMGGAWYAADWSKVGGNYVFPHLNTMFGFATSNVIKTMGIQGGIVQNTTREESIQREERPSYIRTQDEVAWQDTFNRTLVHRDGLEESGYEKPFDTPEEAVTSYPSIEDEFQTEVIGASDKTVYTEK